MKKPNKKLKVIIMIIAPLVLIISAVSIFETISFEEDFTFIAKYPMSDDEMRKNLNPFRRGITKADIDRGIIFTDNDEFNQYTKDFDYTEHYLAFSGKLPIKRISYRYLLWDSLWDLISATSHPATLIVPLDIELDESVETSQYYFLYKVKTKS